MRSSIPKTVEQTVIEYTQLEDTGINEERKAGLKYALDSSGINRAHDKCIIMMSGETGVGKSSLTNHVFGLKLCRTSDTTSETKAATEFSLKVDLPRLKISGMQVSFVDTPGMCDTEGLEQDARNVRAIQKYVEGSLGLCKHPNMILLLIKASDNRFVGKNSKLSKTIRFLVTLNIIDRKIPNLIIVITHIMGLGKKKWEIKKQLIKKCVKDVCSIDAPVIFVENEPEEHDLEINERTGCSQLPNGDVQPHNVSETILEQLDTNQDHLGHIALKEVYAKGDRTQNAEQTMQVNATDSQTPLSFEEQQIRKLLEEICVDSEIEAKLQKCVEKDEIDKQDVGKIDQFCHKLVNEWGIRTFKELQKLTMQFLIELTGCELEDRARDKFAELFELNNSCSVPAACQELRKGFNVLVNDFTPSPVFENFEDNEKFLQSLKRVKFARTAFRGEFYKSNEDFVKSYIDRMMKNDNFQKEKYEKIIAAIRPHPQADQLGQQFLLCDWEVRVKQLDLPNPKQLKLSSPFRTAIEQLPERCDFSDASSLKKFLDFCGIFGTHFVRNAFCGGHVQIGGYMEQTDNDKTKEIHDSLFKLTEHWKSKFSVAADTKELDVFNFDIHISGSKRGNDEQKAKLSSIKSDEMHQWRFNLPKDMVLLKNQLEISPINELIRTAGFEKQAQAMDDALALILGDSDKISKIRAKQNEEREVREAEEKQCREREEQRRLEEEREKMEDERREKEKQKRQQESLFKEAAEREKEEREEKEEDKRRQKERERKIKKREEEERKEKEEAEERERRREEIRQREEREREEEENRRERERESRRKISEERERRREEEEYRRERERESRRKISEKRRADREREQMRREREQSSEPGPPSTSNQAQANTQRNERFQDMEKTRAEAAATIADPGVLKTLTDGMTHLLSMGLSMGRYIYCRFC